MKAFGVLLLLLATRCHSLAPADFLAPEDVQHLSSVFARHLSEKKDLQTTSYALVGAATLNQPINQDVCEYLQRSVDKSDPISVYSAARAAKLLSNCPINVDADVVKSFNERLASEKSVKMIFHLVESLSLLGKKFDSKVVSKTLHEALKTDDSALSIGYAFHVASSLTEGEKAVFDLIKHVIQLADEVDSRMLQYEGVGVTSMVLTGMYRLSAKMKAASPPLSDTEAVKFTSYLISRRTILAPKVAHHLVVALSALADNPYHVPVSVSLHSPSVLSAASPSDLLIRVSDPLGRQIKGQVTVTADTVTRLSDDAVIVSRQQLSKSPSSDPVSLYSLTLPSSRQTPLSPGFYRLQLSLQSTGKQKQPIVSTSAVLTVKLTGSAAVSDLKIGLVHGTDESAALEPLPARVEQLEQLQLGIQLTLTAAGDGRRMVCHQVFLRVSSAAPDGREEAVLVIPADSKLLYRRLVSVDELGSMLNYISGLYKLELIVGDAILESSIVQNLANVSIKFTSPARIHPDIYAPQPEITHVFRPEEPRPPALISQVFTVICVCPVLVMLLGWILVGANISLFPISLAGLGFVAGFGGILVLYLLFWLQLNMFVTLKYLCGLGAVTFLCGHRTLSYLASRRVAAKQKSN